jgi:hypothetical protein
VSLAFLALVCGGCSSYGLIAADTKVSLCCRIQPLDLVPACCHKHRGAGISTGLRAGRPPALLAIGHALTQRVALHSRKSRCRTTPARETRGSPKRRSQLCTHNLTRRRQASHVSGLDRSGYTAISEQQEQLFFVDPVGIPVCLVADPISIISFRSAESACSLPIETE